MYMKQQDMSEGHRGHLASTGGGEGKLEQTHKYTQLNQ